LLVVTGINELEPSVGGFGCVVNRSLIGSASRSCNDAQEENDK
jgi:hypothetical protein